MPRYSIFVGSFTCAVVDTVAGAEVANSALLIIGGTEDDVDSCGAIEDGTEDSFTDAPTDDNTVLAGLAKDSALVL